jgi:DNA-binding LacI/PurR family transcriptional regulator
MSTRPTIAVLSPLLGGFYFGGLLRGIYQEARRHGAQVIAIQTRDAWAPEEGQPQSEPALTPGSILAWQHVDGWIAILNESSGDLLRVITGSGRPLVTLSSLVPGLGCPAVLPDNQGGAAAAVRHLLEHGHRRIGFVGCLEQEDIRQRYAGYQEALREAGIEPDPALFFAATNNVQEGAQPAARQMMAAGMPCSAALVATDLNALGLLQLLQAASRTTSR